MKGFQLFFACAFMTGLWACGDRTDTSKTASEGHAHPDTNRAAETTQPTAHPGAAGPTLHQIMENMMHDMSTMQMTNDPDHDFAMMMRHHHQAAVEMAQVEVRDGKDGELKQLAQKMISAQQGEIDAFNTFLNGHKPAATNAPASQAMMAAMKRMGKGHGSGEESTDHDFADLMIPHHQSAIDMSRAYLPHAKNAEIKKMAEKIIQDQTVEIAQLQTMMKRFH
jgi:uncharacterized protein (DUF305 family)